MDPRNRRRRDLRCPFGCRQAHQKRASSARSAAYYGTASGRVKKKLQNAKRGGKADLATSAEGEGEVFDRVVVRHVQVVTSLVEGRRVVGAEVLEMLARVVRQHRLDRRSRRRDLLLRRLANEPP